MAPSGGASWNPPRAKIQLKLAIQRLRLLGTKKAQLAKTTRREIAGLLERQKIETARIKVEGVMGEDTLVELLEVLELYCELLLARFGLLETVREVDPGVSEAVIGVIHAAPRTELKELHVLREMLMSKFGRDFSLACMENQNNIVPERITSKLAIVQPPSELVDLYLYEIAKAYSVDWRPQGFPDPNEPTPLPDSNVPTVLSTVATDHLIDNDESSVAVQASEKSPSSSQPVKPPLLTSQRSANFGGLSPAGPLPQTPPVDPANAGRTVVLHTNLPATNSGLSGPPTAPIGTSSLNSPSQAVLPSVVAPSGGKKAEEDAFEALTRRFAELKKR